MLSIFKNTKIVSTCGPSITKTLYVESDLAVSGGEELRKEVLGIFENIFLNGVNCVRFNFSHSNSDERLLRIKLINQSLEMMFDNASKNLVKSKNSNLKFFRPVSNMCDTKGPEIRVYTIGNKSGQTYKIGSTISIHCIEKVIGDENQFSILDSTGTYNMANDCKVGSKILIDDGKLSLKILSSDVASGIVKVLVENTHTLKTNKRINLPGADYSMPFLSKNDIEDIKFSLQHDFHLIALSFVNKAEHVEEVKKVLRDSNHNNKPIPLIFSKIETLQSLKNIDSIIEASDGIMVARGDLGLEIPYYEVPYWTKLIIKKCAIKNIPVIVATQMLDSLERNIIPTRAEVTDVYRAVELGSDAVMLSGETAQGLFPKLAVQTMNNISVESEKNANYEKFLGHFKNHDSFKGDKNIQDSIARLHSLISKNNDKILTLVCFFEEVSDFFIKAVSAAKLPVSLTIFKKIDNFESAIKDSVLNNYSICRGINMIGLQNYSGETIEECASNFVSSYNYGFDLDLSDKKVVVLEDSQWKIKDL